MNKEQALQDLAAQMQADTMLPLQESNLVFGEGSIDASVVFIGEAPGLNEDQQKRPFVGRGGQLLNKMLEEIGWQREDVYITNIVKRRPPNNRDPLPEEIQAYKPYLTRQIEILKPKIIVTLGRFSMNYFLPTAKITKDQGKIFRMSSYCVVPMLHPAAALRAPEMMKTFQETFRKLPKMVKICENLLENPIGTEGKETPPSENKLF